MMKSLLPYIEVGFDNNQVVLEVQDLELSDFIEDYLVEECGLEPETIKSGSKDNFKVVKFYFNTSVLQNQIEDALLKLSPTMIESVYKLNNP